MTSLYKRMWYLLAVTGYISAAGIAVFSILFGLAWENRVKLDLDTLIFLVMSLVFYTLWKEEKKP